MNTEAIATKFVESEGLDITTIQQIIQAIQEIIQNCNSSSAEITKSIRKPGLFQRAKATSIIMNNVPNVTRRRAREIADRFITFSSQQTGEDIVGVLFECCNPSQW